MVNIPEQAYSVPRNATPIGTDANTLVFPDISTCVAVAAVPTGVGGQLVGIHIAMMTAASDTAPSVLTDKLTLSRYFFDLRRQAFIQCGNAFRIYAAGRMDTWSQNHPVGFAKLNELLRLWRCAAAPVKALRLAQLGADVASATITITRAGIAAATATGGAVGWTYQYDVPDDE